MAGDPFAPLDLAAEALAARVAPAGRRRLARQLAQALRLSQAARIAAQENPDGSAFAPRKPQAAKPERTPRGRLRRKKGRIRRKVARRAMFAKLRTAAFLRGRAEADGVAVGFEGAAARIARVHQEGLVDQVNRGRPEPRVVYAARRVLGFSPREETTLAAAVLQHLG